MNARLPLASSHRCTSGSAGFTFFEVIIVLVLLGILAVYVLPKTFNPGAMTLRAQARSFASDLQRAQMLATTSGVPVQVQVNDQQYSVQYSPKGVNVIAANVDLSNASFSSGQGTFTFNSLGQPYVGTTNVGQTIVLSSTGASSLTVVVDAVSGQITGP